MQTTLLGLAIAIILAVLAALVGPLLIDWSGHRSIFEAEASRLLGANVRVAGAIDARLLPSPRLTLNDLEVGSGDGRVLVRAATVELALTPLMRGEWRATELHLAGPQVTLSVNAAGQMETPGLALALNPDSLAIERLSIEDGKVSIVDVAGGGTVTLNRFWFNGEAKSLLGPFKGEGAVKIGEELYPYRLSTGRYTDEGSLKLRVNVDPVNHPLSIETDGVLTLGDAPHFDGTISLAKPVGIGLRTNARLTQPWRLSGKIKAGPQSALIEQIEYLYGSEEQGLKLTGVADFKFGKNPRFDGVLSGRQIDLDRVLVGSDGTRPPPAAAIRELIELGGVAFRPAFPISIGLGIDQITLGGNTVQNLRGDISSDAGGWNLDRFEFRAPGYTQVRLSGHLAVDAGGVVFTGPAEVDANDPKVLAAWLEGRSEVPVTPPIDLRALSLRGDVTLGSEKVAIEKLRAEFDRKTVSGRLSYVFAAGREQAKLDAALNAPELDIDAALGFGKALLAGSAMQRPRDMTIAADIGRASVGGFVARNASARLKVDAGGLQIDKLSVTDLGGAAFSASGRIDTTQPTPRGSINVDLTAPDMAPVLAVLSRFAPATVASLGRGTAAMAPAKLRARLAVDGATPTALAKLNIDGSLGKARITLAAQTNADAFVAGGSAGDLKLDAKLDADDGKVLLTMLGLERAVEIEAGPGALTLSLNGPASGDLKLDGRLLAKGLEAKAAGTARPFAAQPSAALRTTIVRANAAPLRGAGVGRAALPVTFDGRLALAGDELAVSEINANVGGTALHGKVNWSVGLPHRISGNVDADIVDGASLIAAATGMAILPAGANKAWVWSTEPFSDGAFGDIAGTVALKVRRLDLPPPLAVREFRGNLRFGKNEMSVDELAGDLAGGRLGGSIVYKDTDVGLTAEAKLALTGGDASMLLPAGPRPPVTGSLDVSAEISGAGLSPVALIGSLQGKGTFAIADAQLAGLDPRAFDAVTRAVDQGLAIDTARIAGVVRTALEGGQLSVKRATGSFAVSSGQLRLTNVAVESRNADLAITGSVDMTDGSLDARLVLSGSSAAAGARPDIFMALRGPVAAPSRTIDVSALTGWLTLRAVELQASRLREIEE
ncbi:MAG: AsmA-like C-terminal region-containing protein, partial [Pseudolabrys sp.]|nr:AsmA-like C-terminal region-containing protein [Pseudolabrys sp.]